MSVRTTTLDSGLRIVTDHMASVESVSVGAWVEVGARHETPDVNGISHFLEHMAFKGTTTRSAQDLAEEIENVGGHINAYTSRENTAYYAKVLKDDLGLAVDVISDILQNSVMEAEELERERGVILQEILQANDTPDDIIFDHFQLAAYPDQAIGRPVLGEADIVKSLSRDVIMDYMHNNYAASNMVVSAAGNVNHDKLVAMVADKFADLKPSADVVADPSRYVGGDFIETRPSLEQVHVVAGFDGVRYDDPGFYSLSVLSTLFGGGMSSRLFQEIREKRGLVYSIYSFVSAYDDGGMLGIYAGTGPDDVAELVPVMVDEIKKVCTEVSEDEVNRARAQLKSSILMSMESTSTRCEQLARQMIVFKRPVPADEVVAKIDQIDVAAVQNVAQQIFATKPTLAVLGPITELPEFKI
ncbi:pitrilysin family protein [Terasakiella sp. A23]|uniref:M16 family metallopeptidase n=1 Tax=Terasakiella sp. FCG-A23 TaxID=3080561 RepID=UPI002952BE2B|nr:pitrilysin family protein [Terasakiella sp. A23]MDV7339676.1 pitrilysin family protein [Terasakiella sp. A23]